MTRAGRIGEPLSGMTVADAAAALAHPGCPVCRHAAGASDKFFSWFAMENYAEQPTLVKLRASAGMCPPHTRRLLARQGASSMLTTVYRNVLPAGWALLGAEHPILGRCPACENQSAATRYAMTTLMAGLRAPGIAALYATADGLCPVHLPEAPPTDAARGRLLAATALARLTDDLPDVEAIAGRDADAPTRARLRAALPAEDRGAHHDRQDGTLERLLARLEVDACPSCLVAGQAERRYLRWMCVVYATAGADGLRSQPGGVCARHLHDPTLLDTGVAGWAAALTRAQWAARLTRLRDRLGDVPPSGLRGRLRHARTAASRAEDGTERRPNLLGELLASRTTRTAAAHAVLRADACMVCRAVAQQAWGQTELLLAALQFPAVARRYCDSHGCACTTC
jgi:hypothetical protein